MLRKHAKKTLQNAINHALALDDTMPIKLKSLDGKVLKLIIMPLQFVFYIHFRQGRVELTLNHEGHVDTTIKSSPMGFIRLSLLPASRVRSLFNDTIELSGDVELGQQVKQLFDTMDIDWEGHLAHFTGDAIAYKLGDLMQKGMAFQHQFRQSVDHTLSSYLQEEARVLPPREEVADFMNDIDELVLQVDRLTAHVNQLQANDEIL